MLPLAGVDIADAVRAIDAVLPVDRAVEPAVFAMAPDGDPGAVVESHTAVRDVLTASEGRPVAIQPVERTDFYAAARKAFAVVLTGETAATPASSSPRASSSERGPPRAQTLSRVAAAALGASSTNPTGPASGAAR